MHDDKIISLDVSDKGKQPNLSLSLSKGDFEKLLKPKKQIHLAVGGTIKVTELELQIIDRPEFQRLRRIRQLGLVHLVYPTAIHTRFDHSLGTLQMASEMVSAIQTNLHNTSEQGKITRYQELLVRLYALLHDICHVPFGHLLEDELRVLTKRHDLSETRLNHFLGAESEIAKLIKNVNEDLYKELYALMVCNPKKNELPDNLRAENYFAHDLVSNTACADLLDYLRRDDFFCGMGFGVRYYFMNFLYLDREVNLPHKRRVYINLYKKRNAQPRRDILSDLCRLLETRYLLNERVYFHHTKLAAGSMLARALLEHASALLDEMSDKERQKLTAGSATTYEKQQAALDLWLYGKADDEVLQILLLSSNKIASQLSRDLLERKLYKCECDIDLKEMEDLYGVNSDDDDSNSKSDAKRKTVLDAIEKKFFGKNALFENAMSRKEFEDSIALEMGLQPGDVLIYAAPLQMNAKLAEMKVLWDSKPRAFKDINDPMVKGKLRSVSFGHSRLWSLRLLLRNDIAKKSIEVPSVGNIRAPIDKGIELFRRQCLLLPPGFERKQISRNKPKPLSIDDLLKPAEIYFRGRTDVSFVDFVDENRRLLEKIPHAQQEAVLIKIQTWIGRQEIRAVPYNRHEKSREGLDPIVEINIALREIINGENKSDSSKAN